MASGAAEQKRGAEQADSFSPQGSFVALPTPFRGGAVDYDLFSGDVERHRRAGTDGVVVAGTTGEGSVLSEAERTALFQTATRAARGQTKVICNVGTNDTRISLRMARSAQDCGADGVMAIVPYYNRPQARGIQAHFAAIAQVVPSMSVTLYDVPQRTGCELPLEVAASLAKSHRNIRSLKLASMDLDRVELFIQESGLEVLCGEDRMIGEFMDRGAVGAISVLGNVLPRETRALIQAVRHDPRAPRARSLAAQLLPLVQALFIETNPVPLKTVLALLFDYPREVRLPLVELEKDHQRLLEEVLEGLSLTSPQPSSVG